MIMVVAKTNFALISAKAKRAQFVKGVNKMSHSTGNLQVVSFVNFPPLLSEASVSGAPPTTRDMVLLRHVTNVNKNQLLTEG